MASLLLKKNSNYLALRKKSGPFLAKADLKTQHRVRLLYYFLPTRHCYRQTRDYPENIGHEGAQNG